MDSIESRLEAARQSVYADRKAARKSVAPNTEQSVLPRLRGTVEDREEGHDRAEDREVERERILEEVLDRGACAIHASWPNDGWAMLDNGEWINPPQETSYYPKTDSGQMHLGSLINFGMWKWEERKGTGRSSAHPRINQLAHIPEEFLQAHPVHEFIACTETIRPPQEITEMQTVERTKIRKKWFKVPHLLFFTKDRYIEEPVTVQEQQSVVVGHTKRQKMNMSDIVKGFNDAADEPGVTVFYHVQNIPGTKEYSDDVGRGGNFLQLRIVMPQSTFERFAPLLKEDPGMIRTLAKKVYSRSVGDHDDRSLTKLLPPYAQWDADSKSIHGMYILDTIHEPKTAEEQDYMFQKLEDRWNEDRVFPLRTGE